MTDEQLMFNDPVFVDTDYIGAITRQWNGVCGALEQTRHDKAILSGRIKELVAERQRLLPLVRRVAPQLVAKANGDE